jgi:hypothetical protein
LEINHNEFSEFLTNFTKVAQEDQINRKVSIMMIIKILILRQKFPIEKKQLRDQTAKLFEKSFNNYKMDFEKDFGITHIYFGKILKFNYKHSFSANFCSIACRTEIFNASKPCILNKNSSAINSNKHSIH